MSRCSVSPGLRQFERCIAARSMVISSKSPKSRRCERVSLTRSLISVLGGRIIISDGATHSVVFGQGTSPALEPKFRRLDPLPPSPGPASLTVKESRPGVSPSRPRRLSSFVGLPRLSPVQAGLPLASPLLHLEPGRIASADPRRAPRSPTGTPSTASRHGRRRCRRPRSPGA